MKNILICFLIIFSLILTACPSKLTLEKVKRINSQIATASFETVEAIRELYRDGKLTLPQKDKIAAFDALVKRFEEVYKTADNVPRAEWIKALNLFSAEVVEKLVDVLVELKVIQTSQKLKDSINIIISLIRILASGFKVETEVKARLAAAQG